jgi:hypothetical protein
MINVSGGVSSLLFLPYRPRHFVPLILAALELDVFLNRVLQKRDDLLKFLLGLGCL